MPPKRMKSRKITKVLTPLPTSNSVRATNVLDYIYMFYGPPGVGKTSLVSQLGKVLFISTDRGTRFLSTMREEVHNWEQIKQVIQKLEKLGNAVSQHYEMVCIDHIDDFCNMAEEDVCATLEIEALGDAGWAKGWKRYKQNIRTIIQRLLQLDLGVCFICHEQIKTIRTRGLELEKTMPRLSKSAYDIIIPMTDLIGYCGFRSPKVKINGKVVRKEVRTLETVPREDLYAKDRTTRRKPLKGWELLDGQSFINTFGKGVTSNGESKSKKKSKKKVGRRARH